MNGMKTKGNAFQPSDEQRQVAYAPKNDDVLVVAGAGSGKTTTMTARVNHLIACKVPPERILGLTFTKKAAAELSEKVSGGLQTGTNMLLKPTVMTYDAFFQSIVRQYGLLVGFDQDTQPLSDAGAIQLASNVIEAHLDELFAASGQDGDDGQDGESNTDEPDGTQQGKFRTLVGKLLNLSHAIGGAMIGGDCDSISEAVRRIRHWDDAFIERVQRIVDADIKERNAVIPSRDPLGEDEKKRRKRAKKDTDEQYAEKVRKQEEEWRQQRADAALFHCAKMLDATKQRNVLLNLVEAYEQAKREAGMAEFSDFTIAAYQLVRRFPSIGQQYRHRYTHVLLDEYQDTSTTQSELIAALFHPDAGGSIADAGRSAVTAVGDPYQSIYAWRGASPGALRIFQRAFDLEQPGFKPYPMTISRRNPRMVLQMANNLTLGLRRTHRRRSSSRMSEVDVLPLNNNPDNIERGTVGVQEYATLGQEIDAVVRFAKFAIARHTNADPAADAKERPHVAVLFRSKRQMPYYEQALRAKGLSVQTVGYSALLERADVRDVLALLRVAADPTDSQSLMRLLATPRFHMEARQLTALARCADQRDTEQRYQALVQAGYATGKETARQRAEVVREHRGQLPHMVYLSDVVADTHEPADLAGCKLDETAVDAVVRAGGILREVRQAMGLPLEQVVRAAIRALDLDVDTVLAQAFADSRQSVNPTLAHAPVESIIELVGTYTQEIVQAGQSTLRGFISWIDSLKTVDDPTAAAHTEPVDVVLMTIHQAKGLQWDAVAVVDVNDKTFPSNQGDSLSVKPADDAKTVSSTNAAGEWEPPEYTEKANTWLTCADMVPAPVRADADILPRFPHDSVQGADPTEAFSEFEDTLTLADEEYGTGRNLPIDGMDSIDKNKLFLTQREEYGRRLHEDERRLAYVAVTRAKHEVFVTATQSSTIDMWPEDGKSNTRSVFWQEMYDSMRHYAKTEGLEPAALPSWADRRELEADQDTDPKDGHPHTLASVGQPLPDGFFVGDGAQDFEDAVVGQAWTTPVELIHEKTSLAWPANLSDEIRRKLDESAQETLEWMTSAESAKSVESGKSVKSEKSAKSAVSGESGESRASAGLSESPQPTESPESKPSDASQANGQTEPWDINETDVLSRRMRALLNDMDLQPQEYQLSTAPDDLDDQVKQTAMRLMANSRRSVTSLQTQAGQTDNRKLQQYWRGMIRPIPRIASPSAEAGTLFHAWAEQFMNAYDDSGIIEDTDASGIDGQMNDAAVPVSAATTREAMISDLHARTELLSAAKAENPEDSVDVAQGSADAVRSGASTAGSSSAGSSLAGTSAKAGASATAGTSAKGTALERKLVTWERRLVASRWAKRRPQAAERQIVISLPQLDDIIVHGKLDAVFYGGLDPQDDTKRFTVVDWKTGRKPRKPSDIDEKLAQLDMYRLLLSRVENIPLDSIDATLYYLSEPQEADRELHASGKTEQDILAELSSGIPEESDND